MKRMLFNATHQEELRVAIVDGQKLLDLDLETVTHHQKKGNIYKGVVTRVEPSLEAAFVDYGAERQGFLPLKEISRSYFSNYSASTPMAQVRIQDVIKEGQELVLQVEKDERGNKGAALTSFISLAGRFLVLMPDNPKGGGISRRIEGEDRVELREHMNRLDVPSEHALIARTAGIGRSFEEIQWDLDYLLNVWKAISEASSDRAGPFLIYQESNLVVRAIRDYLRTDITEILIDDKAIYERARKFMEQVMPQNLSRLKFYEDDIPLFSRFQIEHQIEAAFSRQVRLASGGALVIDHTEAVVTIDVNSAKATKGADIEETALQTNLEAADEIARQLRIRDLGGLLVIDMIDMNSSRNQRAVESRLIDALKVDRARVQVGRISRFGLLEMSRQRLRSSLGESNYLPCPRCSGNGTVRSTTSSALSILRILEEEAQKENTEAIHANLPYETATYLLNEKRHELSVIEKRLGTTIFVVPTPTLETPHFQIKRLRAEDLGEVSAAHSFQIEHDKEETMEPNDFRPEAARETPIIDQQDIATAAPPPIQTATAANGASAGNGLSENRGGFFKRVFGGIFSAGQDQPEPQTENESDEKPRPQRSGNRSARSRGGDNRQRRQQSRRSGSSQSGGQDGRRARGNSNRNTGSSDSDNNRSSTRGRRGGQNNRRNNQQNRSNSRGDDRNNQNASSGANANENSADNQRDAQQADGNNEGRQQRPRRRGRGRGRQNNNQNNNQNQNQNQNQQNANSNTSANDDNANKPSSNSNRGGDRKGGSSEGRGGQQRRGRGRGDSRRNANAGDQRQESQSRSTEDLPDDIGNRRSPQEMRDNPRPEPRVAAPKDASEDRSHSKQKPTDSGGSDAGSLRSSANDDSANDKPTRSTGSEFKHREASSTDRKNREGSLAAPRPAEKAPEPSSTTSKSSSPAPSPEPAPSSPKPSSPPAVTGSPSDYLSPKTDRSSDSSTLVQIETGGSGPSGPSKPDNPA